MAGLPDLRALGLDRDESDTTIESAWPITAPGGVVPQNGRDQNFAINMRIENMTNKSNFTSDEWKLILSSPMLVGMAVTLADPSGLWGTHERRHGKWPRVARG